MLNGSLSGALLSPWLAEPYRLWSLYDMWQAFLADFAAAFSNLTLEAMSYLVDPPEEPIDWGEVSKTISKRLTDLGQACAKLPVSSTVRRQIERTQDHLSLESPTERAMVIHALADIRQNIIGELRDHLFFFVSRPDVDLLRGNTDPFGKEVKDIFPETSKDIVAAGRCLALKESTAAVFHLMRVLEKGLWRFARIAGVPMSAQIEQKNWGGIIGDIETAVERYGDTAPRGPEKTARLQVYSELAAQFRYFKDAWRNHVSHSRAFYDEREAQSVWAHTRDFMITLATADV